MNSYIKDEINYPVELSMANRKLSNCKKLIIFWGWE